MKVPLQDELDFVKSYTYLEQIRFGDTLHVNIACNEEALKHYIVPVSIQMFIENALKHNINTKDSPLKIRIYIGKECVSVTNGLQLRASVSKNRIGLDNLEKQYHIHNHHIKVEKSDSEFTITLPLLQLPFLTNWELIKSSQSVWNHLQSSLLTEISFYFALIRLKLVLRGLKLPSSIDVTCSEIRQVWHISG